MEAVKEFDVAKIREDFPILKEKVHGKPLVYFDNAATSQKPKVVLDALYNYYQHYNANIHRGLHTLADKATMAYENTRIKVAKFLNAERKEEIVFTRGTTEAINLVASSFGDAFINEGDEIILSALEHHSNIVPWQMLCQRKKAKLKIIPMNDKGELLLDEYEKLLSEKTKLVAVMHVSNALGTINPVKDIIATAHKHGAKVLIDGAQSVPHMKVDVQDLDADFYVFSAHKMVGPTGMGVLYGKYDLLEAIPPYQGGGEMIEDVSFEKTTYNTLPYKFEAGTPNIADTIAMDTAIDYMESIGYDAIHDHEKELLDYATAKLEDEIEDIKIYGKAENKSAVISFLVDGVHPQDLGILLDSKGVAIRTGHHCAQPIMQRFDIPGTCRASFMFYNTKEEIDVFVDALKENLKMLK